MKYKIAHGISTKIVTITDIVKGTNFTAQGRDTAEKMKYFIKAAHEQWDTLYVMLVGNYKQVPTRDVWIETDVGQEYQELNFACDLYFADLYDGNGSFCSWDSNNNGIYGEWPYPDGHAAVDKMDLVPDVHLARLACMTKAEVRTQVKKIINYENTTKGASWFNRMVVAGGDTFPNEGGGTNINEGEVTTQYALNEMPQFTGIKLWTSLGNISTENITVQLDQGAGFVYLCGHGNPKNWATHPHDNTTWISGFNNKDIKPLSNANKCPILMVGGCHNSEIDVTPMNFITGFLEGRHQLLPGWRNWFGEYFLYDYVPECWSWVFVKGSGGAMASMGSCGFGCDGDGDYNHDGIPDCTQEYDGWFEINFFHLYGHDNVSVLGNIYDQDVTQYLPELPGA